VIGGDGPLPRKPDPAGLRQTMADARASAAETLMVGDSVIDWETAVAASTAVCLARYGFGFSGFPEENLRTGDLVIDAPRDLQKWL
jgi:phosphoglycolate phosphatase-like HAD superfamily hydrolase